MIETFPQGVQNHEWGLWAILFLFFAASLVGMDIGEIRITPDGVVQRRFLGLQRKRIPWAGAGASYVPGHQVLVVGADGTEIVHSQYHADPEEFVSQLRRRKVPVLEGDVR